MENSVTVLWSVASTLNFIFASILTSVVLTPKYKKIPTILLYVASSSIIAALTMVWYSFFIMNDAIPIIFYSIAICFIGHILYKEHLAHIIFISVTNMLITVISTFLFCGTTDQIIGSKLGLFDSVNGPYTRQNILFFFVLKMIVLSAISIGYFIFIRKPLYKMTNTADGQLKNYLIIPISSLISFAVITYIANAVGILPTNKYFLPLFAIIGFIYISEYATLAYSVYWTAKAISAEQIMYVDGLTGLSNRNAFEKFEEKLDNDIKNGVARFSLIIIDLNFLKKMNDTYGHDKGDIALKILADDIRSMFNGCNCFRIGGDEFAVIISGKNVDVLSFLLTNIGSSITKTGKPNEWENISAATGYAVYSSEKDTSFHDVFVRADAQMYNNKVKMKGVRKD